MKSLIYSEVQETLNKMMVKNHPEYGVYSLVRVLASGSCVYKDYKGKEIVFNEYELKGVLPC